MFSLPLPCGPGLHVDIYIYTEGVDRHQNIIYTRKSAMYFREDDRVGLANTYWGFSIAENRGSRPSGTATAL